MSDDHCQGIRERAQLIEARARMLAEHAVATGEVWTRRLGAPPLDATDRERWLEALYYVVMHDPEGNEFCVS